MCIIQLALRVEIEGIYNPIIKSNIIGLTVPGMPAGINVPGMEINNEKANFDVLAIDSKGKSSVWTHYE